MLPKHKVRVRRSLISDSVIRLNDSRHSDSETEQRHDDESSIADAETGELR